MYHFLKGRITEKITSEEGSEKLILEVSGIGFEIQTTSSGLSLFGKVGENTTVYTTLIHKEDAMSLIGFPTLLERELFNLLFSVSGIGPKTALNLLNNLTVSEIAYSIISENTDGLTKSPGIGGKTASRIILELKEKIKNWKHLPIAYLEKRDGKTAMGRNGGFENEARSVLLALGYSASEINQAFNQAKANGDQKEDSESLIHFSLKWFSSVNVKK